jgi:hypothetical protein
VRLYCLQEEENLLLSDVFRGTVIQQFSVDNTSESKALNGYKSKHDYTGCFV